jgi:FeS assembly SUF system protein
MTEENNVERDVIAVGMACEHVTSSLTTGEVKGTSVLDSQEIERLTNDITAALKTVYDPEIPVDIYELGLIYKVEIDDDSVVKIEMTLTAPGCPVAGEMPIWVENAVASVTGVSHVEVEMVFDPPWDMSRMSDEARVALNMW